MIELTRIADLRDALRAARATGSKVGLVPTMGFLHEGHVSLMKAARAECDIVVTTIFVNPLQFGANEDLSTYPRDLARDRDLAAQAGVDYLFCPPTEEMYPEPINTSVSVSGVSAGFEGATRPGHFDGVATVVTKLFNIAGECRAYFGEKDFQQLAVVRRMTRDLSFPIEIVGCPTVRDDDGLALSSRNSYLNEEERKAALVLIQALSRAKEAIFSGVTTGSAIQELMAQTVDAEPLAELDYAEVVDPNTLVPLDDLSLYEGNQVRLLIAAQVGSPRLLDNIGVEVPRKKA